MTSVSEISGYELGPRAEAAWPVRYGIWLLLAATALLFGIASVIPYGTAVNTPLRRMPVAPLRAAAAGRAHFLVREGTAVREGQPIAQIGNDAYAVFVSRDVATKIRVPQSATLITPSGSRRVTITAILPAQNDLVPLRVTVPGSLPPQEPATLSIPLPQSHLLPILMRSVAP